jgi:hypothetical protein
VQRITSDSVIEQTHLLNNPTTTPNGKHPAMA